MKKILIPDNLGFPKQAAVVRSLAQKGYTCDHAWNFQGIRKYFKSRYVNHLHQISPVDNSQKYVNDIIFLANKHSYDLILPFGTHQLLTIQPHLNRLPSHCKHLIPSKKCLDIADDKLQLYEYCCKSNIETPKTFSVESTDCIPQIAEELKFPVVLKPRENISFSMGLKFLSDASDDASILDRSYIIQEFIPGNVHDVNLIAKNGEVYQSFTQVRKLMYPIEGGAGAIVYSTYNPVIEAIASKIIRELNWSGMAQIEFKLDPRDGQYKLIEINPRFYGTVDLAIQCGIDFPELLVQLASGKEPEKHQSYQTGVRYKFLFGRTTLAMLQTLAFKRWKDLIDPQLYQRKISGFSWKDPLPDLYSFLLDIKKICWKRDLKIRPELPSKYINQLNCKLPEMYIEKNNI